MGLTGGTCGAVTGAIMVIGLLARVSDPRDYAARARIYGLVESFLEEFEARNHTTECRELLGHDLSTFDGLEGAVKAEVFQTKCSKYIADAIEILEEMF
jgi:C_GCAxxG_C_C family probable redox protein